MDKIGNLLHHQFSRKDSEKTVRELCRFDMFVRWPEHTNRRIKHFTYRGDHYEKDPQKMLWSLIRYFLKSYPHWVMCQVRDNTKPLDDEERIVFWYNNKEKIIVNRLSMYSKMLKDHPLPDWLK